MKKMNLIKACALMLTGLFSTQAALADEGMWLPMFIKRLNYADMQQKGLQLTAEEIYSVNNSSLKDAIVVLNWGMCTAEMISPKGLMLTNHHCAFGTIQSNSTVEHDYLTDGFWAMAYKEELPAEGMTASYLKEMKDLTEQILAEVSIELMGEERDNAIRAAIEKAKEEMAADYPEHYDIQVKGFFEGNEFYGFAYETFKDVRLVGAPPSSIGKYGGDTDNWMWPRHTGDFSMLRVYQAEDGMPAEYSESNVPYSPKHFLPISLNGVEQGDFSMIMGYPGSTDRYLSSYGVSQAIELEQPAIVELRTVRLALMKEDMNASDEVRIKYASKYARVSNYWKYFQGQIRGLKRLKVVDKKKAIEDEFDAWVSKDEERKKIYGNVTKDLKEGYEAYEPWVLARMYINEAAFASELTRMAYGASGLEKTLMSEESTQEDIDAAVASLKARAAAFYKDYNMGTDRKVTAKLYQMWYNGLAKHQKPSYLTELATKHRGDFDAMAETVFKKSIFSSEADLMAFLEKPSAKKLQKDPAYKMASNFIEFYRTKLGPEIQEPLTKIENANRLFVHGLRKSNPDKVYYPNANSSMRLTYGTVGDYYPSDAVYYNYYTTLEGVMEKEDPKNDEFIVPEKLKELYKNKDYGQYGQDGEMRVCFISNNDITGGNSGSPVINGKGELIGCAFDGNWEAMSGDIAFEDKLQRTISVDIRYVLFIVDKYAGATNLIDEMKLVKSEAKAEAKPVLNNESN